MKKELKVVLIGQTSNMREVIHMACRQCYSADFVAASDRDFYTTEQQEELIKKVVESGHHSTIEHVSFTFAIEGISRALSHQLVRHRIASYSQQSQRYVDASDMCFIVPPSISNNPQALSRFYAFLDDVDEAYEDIHEILIANGRTVEQANEDARFVLPQAAETRIVVTMNCRALLNFFAHRCCNRAQWEIRALAREMLKICQCVLPEVFENAGAPCVRGGCPEGKFSCKKEAENG